MVRNYLKVALKSIFKHKGHTLSNVVGLAVGLASCFLVILFIIEEISFDRYHEKYERIFRITSEYVDENGYSDYRATTDHKLAPLLKEYFPEIEYIVRIERNRRTVKHVVYRDKKFIEPDIVFVDGDFFKVFSFKLLRGNPQEALYRPNTAVITQKTARKYFGDEDPIGKTVTIKQWTSEFAVEITGIIEEIPQNSHFSSNFLISQTTTQRDFYSRISNNWIVRIQFTYVLLKENSDPQKIQERFSDFAEQRLPDNLKGKLKFYIQPLSAIHLYSHLNDEYKTNGDINNIYVYGTIALVILLISCINYINLATARSQTRTREIGIRKVIGAYKKQVFSQFLVESVLTTLIALVLAVFIVGMAIPIFNRLFNATLTTGHLGKIEIILLFVIIAVLVGIISGSYPAFYLSSLKPISIFRLQFVKKGGFSYWLRSGLIVLQFCISIVLIISTIIIYKQIDFLQHKKVGINSDNLLRVQLYNRENWQKKDLLKSLLLQNPNIQSVGSSNAVIGDEIVREFEYKMSGEDDKHIIKTVTVDYDFFKTIEADIISGRNFSIEMPGDENDAFILNQAAVNTFGSELTIGNQLENPNKKGQVIGIVEDFHFRSFHNKIEPLVFILNPRLTWHLYLRITGKNIPDTIQFIKDTWEKFDPAMTLVYSFVKDDLNSFYQDDKRFLSTFISFAILAILLSCIGMLGLLSFTTKRRAREIGIRKVLGASVRNISLMLIKNNALLILLASLISYPIAFSIMKNWLTNYAYQVNIGLHIYLAATAVALIIAIITVGFHTIKAAAANPVDVLKNE